MLPKLKYQLVLMFVLQFLDGTLTAAAIDKYDMDIEANPVVRWLMDMTWPAMGLLLSKCVASGIGYFVYKKGYLKPLMVVNYVYFIAVIVNALTVFA